MKISVVLGTRPEIIKLAPLIKDLQKKQLDYFVLHTGQHYSYRLDRVFFEQLELPEARYNIDSGSGSHAEETGKMLVGIEETLLKEKPDIVVVEGDTNSVLAGALAAVKLGVKVGHVEAGLRSYDRTMPEEINRVVTDHVSDLLFAPTPKAREILLGEGIDGGKISVTGNTIVDAVYQNRELADKKSNALNELNLKSGQYFLVTLHRQENVDNPARFASILEGLNRLVERHGMPVVYPVHPRSRKKLDEFGLKTGDLKIIDPVDFLDFLQLESNAWLILTDSGGVQEEACILKVPCVTLRDNTERPETVRVGANVLAGAVSDRIIECVAEMLEKERNWDNPFGDGRAAERIAKIIMEAGDG